MTLLLGELILQELKLLLRLYFTNSTAPGTSITITTGSAHGLEIGDMVALESVTMPTGSGINKNNIEYTNDDRQVCQVITVPSNVTFTITSPTAETAGGGSDLTSGSACIVSPYQRVGPLNNRMVMDLELEIMVEQLQDQNLIN